MALEGVETLLENIGLLKDAIYDHSANYKNRGGQLIMGQKIPPSYHALDKQLETVQQEVRQGIREPIMTANKLLVCSSFLLTCCYYSWPS